MLQDDPHHWLDACRSASCSSLFPICSSPAFDAGKTVESGKLGLQRPPDQVSLRGPLVNQLSVSGFFGLVVFGRWFVFYQKSFTRGVCRGPDHGLSHEALANPKTTERNRPQIERGGPDPPMNLRSENAGDYPSVRHRGQCLETHRPLPGR